MFEGELKINFKKKQKKSFPMFEEELKINFEQEIREKYCLCLGVNGWRLLLKQSRLLGGASQLFIISY